MAAGKVQFDLKKRSSNVNDSVVEDKDISIWEAVKEKLGGGANKTNTIFLAELKDSHDKNKCWIPFFLPCGFIKTDSNVEWEDISKSAQSRPQGIPKTMECTLFLVSAHEKGLTKFTVMNEYKNVGRDINMCVVASPDQTFVQVFTEDGRFKGVDNFQLSETTGNCSNVDMNQKPADRLKSKYELLKIRVTSKSRKKRGSSDNNTSQQPLSSSSFNLEDSVTPKSSINSNSTKSYSSKDVTCVEKMLKHVGCVEKMVKDVGYVEKMLKDGKCYEFSKDPKKLTTKERYTQMSKCQRALVRYKFLRPDLLRSKKKIPKAKLKAVQDKFANKNVIARPVDFSKNICKLYDSVGYLKYGNSHHDLVQATCFLVSQKIVATNYHVVKDIQDALKSSMPGNDSNSKISVIFSYEKGGRRFDDDNSYELETPIPLFNLHMDESFDFAFLRLKRPVEGGVKPLGEYVRCNVPSNGIVSIVGHPHGQRKQEELCSIISRDDLQNRSRECGLHYSNGVVNVFDLLNHAENDETLSYDVGKMFHGSSGSPIFDMNCNVIGIHTGGFPINDSSIMEYGITFRAIIERLKSIKGFKDFVKEMFPKCDEISHPLVKRELNESEDMEVDYTVSF